MSDTYVDTVVVKWVKDHKFPPAVEDDLLVISVPTGASANTDGPVSWNSAVAGIVEVKTVWTSEKETLNNTSLHIEVPGFGLAPFFSGKHIDLKNSQPISVSIDGGGVYGTVQFNYSTDQKDIKLDWKLNVPWFGTLDDGHSLFPKHCSSAFLVNKLQNLQVIPDAEVAALKEAPLSEYTVVKGSAGNEMILFPTSIEESQEKDIAKSYIHDNVGAGDAIVTLLVASSFKSESNVLDISFLGIFQLVGTISPAAMAISATLYAKIPFIGRVKLVEIKGNLITGVSVMISLVIASGKVVASAWPNASGKHDLYINLKLKVKFVKEFNTGDLKLFGLP